MAEPWTEDDLAFHTLQAVQTFKYLYESQLEGAVLYAAHGRPLADDVKQRVLARVREALTAKECPHCGSRNWEPLDQEYECYDCGEVFAAPASVFGFTQKSS